MICTNFQSLDILPFALFSDTTYIWDFITFHICFSYIWVYSRWTHSYWRSTMIDCTTHVDIFLPCFAGFYINLAIVSHSQATPPSSLWSLCLLKLRINFIKTNGLLHQEEKNSNTTVIKYITFNWNEYFQNKQYWTRSSQQSIRGPLYDTIECVSIPFAL